MDFELTKEQQDIQKAVELAEKEGDESLLAHYRPALQAWNTQLHSEDNTYRRLAATERLSKRRVDCGITTYVDDIGRQHLSGHNVVR